MQIPNSTQTSISFMPPPAAELIQQDQQQAPVVATSTTANGAQSQEFGGAKQESQPALYTRQGQVANADVQTDAPEKSAVSSEKTISEPATDQKTASESAENVTDASTKNIAGKELTLEQQEELLHLQQRDQEVRVHEQQHASVGGQHTGTPSYDYKTGPDGKQYVVEGSVSVNLSPVAGDPNATIDKMRQVKAAALAPAQPSTADKNAAAAADVHIAQATAELMQAHEPTAESADEAEPTTAAEAGKAPTGAEADKAAAKEPSINAKATTNTSPSDAKTVPQTAANDKAQLAHINQVIAGVYGKSAQVQSQQLLNLA